MEGEYIKFLSHAERLEPNCISQLVAGLQARPECRIAASKRQRLDPHGKILPDVLNTAPLYNADCIIDGRDFLRCQTRAHHSLAGELSASMFYRDDLLALTASQHPLFAINDQSLPDLAGLVVYSKLLPQTNLLWFVQPLLGIRFSMMYKQPHQNENDEEVIKVIESIKAQPWYSDGAARDNVRLAELDRPDCFEAKDILSTQHQYVVQTALKAWNGVRSLQPFQQKRLQQMAAEFPSSVNVAVVISVTAENREKLSLTLDSLAHQGISTLKLHPLLVG
ncbi:MAG TPA: O-antigen biosynthesis protein, partial [Erwinia persicina]|nr:O-antigen biosynthesis protein [Erwinia persicina]